MSETKWTPGPWRVRDEDGPPMTDVKAGDRLLASAYPAHYRLSDPSSYGSADAILRAYAEAEANARLIAAAPELYEAVRGLIETLDYWRKAFPTTFGEHQGALVSPQLAKSYVRAKAALAEAIAA